jgi:acyl-CoA thioester hydrolase
MADMPDPVARSPLPLDAYPLRATDRLRYGDTDRQGHVNNAVFATFFETGRVAFLYDPANPVLPEGASFVIARLVIDFRAEINWPGEVEIGTYVSRVGRSSCTLSQAVFQNGKCVASGESVVVLMDEATRKSRPLTDAIMALLERYRS